MNIRDNFLKDNLLNFKELESTWHNKPIFELTNIIAKADFNQYLSKNNILLGLTDTPLIYLSDLRLNASKINPDLLIFASRHRSEAARPAFLTHSTGNWTQKADYGGNPRKLSKTSAILLKCAFLNLKAQIYIKKLEDFSLDIEVSHHGPTSLDKPLIFVELGSSEQEWIIEEVGRLVAHAILYTCFDYIKSQQKEPPIIGIGFGGTHYAPQFKKLIDSKNVALSFICPKYFIQNLNRNMIEQMLKNTLEIVDCFIIDWKGTNSADKKHLLPLLEEFNLPIKKTKDF